MKRTQRIGIITAGGDSPGLNAAIRAIGKTAHACGMEVVGFRQGFRGLAENLTLKLDRRALSGILTVGGTILGTGRDKPHKMEIHGVVRDMRDVMVRNYKLNKLDALVCIGGGGTHKNALRLLEKGLNIVTLPKTIDNDVALTDSTIGFDTALDIATDALDRLHSTAHSHHRIIIAEIMGHRAGWLALGAGIAGGADVILIPEIPYDVRKIAAAIRARSKAGTKFSIVAVAEGALSIEDAKHFTTAAWHKKNARNKTEKLRAKHELMRLTALHQGNTLRLAKQLEDLTKLEARVSILGYVQRGGTPSSGDRLLATRLGTAAAELIHQNVYGVMVAARGEGVKPIPIVEVAGKLKTVPTDHSWITSARRVGTSFGD